MAKFCSTCGKEIHENAVVCPNCGCAIQGAPAVNDTPSMGLNILSFLIPIAGLILFCVNINSKPKSAKSYGIWALAGVLAGFLLSACSVMML